MRSRRVGTAFTLVIPAVALFAAPGHRSGLCSSRLGVAGIGAGLGGIADAGDSPPFVVEPPSALDVRALVRGSLPAVSRITPAAGNYRNRKQHDDSEAVVSHLDLEVARGFCRRGTTQ